MTKIFALVVLLATSLLAMAQPGDPTDPRVDTLKALSPLPKVHYSWPLPDEVLASPALLKEYARVTKAITLSGRWHRQPQVDAAVVVCKATGAKLSLSFSPYHSDETEEMVRAKLDEHVAYLSAANGIADASVPVSVILLDSESLRFQAGCGAAAAANNEMMVAKHDAIYDACKQIFPTARVEWYNFGGTSYAHSTTGWVESPMHAPGEKHQSYSVSLYNLMHPIQTRMCYRLTAERAWERGTHNVVAWVALGAGYKWTKSGPVWTRDWNYDTEYSRQAGAELNIGWYGERYDRYAPYQLSDIVVFYPQPFDPRTPHWLEHFVAYANGAAGK